MNVMPLLDVSMREEALDFMEEERRRYLSALKPELSKAQSVGAGLLLAYAVNMAGSRQRVILQRVILQRVKEDR